MKVSNTVSVEVSATLLVDELLHQRLERRAVLVERGDRLLAGALAGAHIRLLVGDEIGGGEEPVLEIVDAEVGRFAVGDRAQVPGDLDARACAPPRSPRRAPRA